MDPMARAKAKVKGRGGHSDTAPHFSLAPRGPPLPVPLLPPLWEERESTGAVSECAQRRVLFIVRFRKGRTSRPLPSSFVERAGVFRPGLGTAANACPPPKSRCRHVCVRTALTPTLSPRRGSTAVHRGVMRTSQTDVRPSALDYATRGPAGFLLLGEKVRMRPGLLSDCIPLGLPLELLFLSRSHQRITAPPPPATQSVGCRHTFPAAASWSERRLEATPSTDCP